MREGRAAIILQRPEHRIGIDLVPRTRQRPAAVIVAKVVTQRRHPVHNVCARRAGFQNVVLKPNGTVAVVEDAAASSSRVAADRGLAD